MATISLRYKSFFTFFCSLGSEELQQVKISEAHSGTNTKAKQYSKLREMHKAIFALLQNPTLFFLNLAGASEGLIIAGFAAFLPKQIENQFSVTAVSSALIMGKRFYNNFFQNLLKSFFS